MASSITSRRQPVSLTATPKGPSDAVDDGTVVYVHAYGIRNAKGDPLTTNTVMYGALLTKTVFAYT